MCSASIASCLLAELLLLHTTLLNCQIVFPEDSEVTFCDNTCKKIADGFEDVKCKCDRLCSTFKDCCIDSPYKGRSSRPAKSVCLVSSQTNSVYMVRNCKERWRGQRGVARNCTQQNDLFRDPAGQVPVTNIQTGTTYKNQYCAVCNDDSNVTPWQIQFICSFPKEMTSMEEAMDNVDYQQGRWGVWVYDNKKREWVFQGCEITAEPTDSLQDKVRICYEEGVSQCAPGWTDATVRRKCQEYFDPVFAKDVAYRNYHCALCNRVRRSDLVCLSIQEKRRWGWGTRSGIPNFAMLMDFSDDCGDKCPCGQTWDPFFKKCRRIAKLQSDTE